MSYFYRPSAFSFTSSAYNGGAPLVLSDHGRSEVKMDFERIENRERMASGRMRSKFIANKRSFSVNWDMLPSRSEFTADKYASALDLENFYESVSGQFSVTLYGDIDTGVSLTAGQAYGTFNVFFSSFSSAIVKRGKEFDFWNVSLSLEEA